MDTLNLRIKITDALKITIKNMWLPVVLGAGLAAFQGHLSPNAITFIIPILLLIISVVSLTVWSIPCLTLTENGIGFKNWRGRNEFCSWIDEIIIDNKVKKDPQMLYVKNSLINRTYKVPKILFTYPETKDYIISNAPENHPFRDLLNEHS